MKRALIWVGVIGTVFGGTQALADTVVGVVEAVDPERRAVTLQGDSRTYLLSPVMPLVVEAIRIEAGDRVILTFERNADVDVVIHVEGDGTDLGALRRPQTGAMALVFDPLRTQLGPRVPAGDGGAVAAVPVPNVTREATAPVGADAPMPLVPQVAGTVVEMNAATRTVMLDNGQSFRVDPSVGMASLRPGNRVVLRLGETGGEFRVVQVIPG